MNVTGSIGFVQFKVAKRAGVAEGMTIENYADIFFDFNAPIRTPTSVLQVEETSRTINKPLLTRHLKVSPNPWQHQARIELSGPLEYGKQLDVINSQGQVVHRMHFPERALTLEDQQWPPGFYILQVRSEAGRIVARGKMVVQ